MCVLLCVKLQDSVCIPSSGKKEQKNYHKKIQYDNHENWCILGDIFSYLFLQKLKGDRNDESCAINEFFCLPLRLKNANCSFLLSTKERKCTQCGILSFFFLTFLFTVIDFWNWIQSTKRYMLGLCFSICRRANINILVLYVFPFDFFS